MVTRNLFVKISEPVFDALDAVVDESGLSKRVLVETLLADALGLDSASSKRVQIAFRVARRDRKRDV